MPLNFNFVERFPIPSLKNYAGFSCILLSAMLYYSYDTVVNDEGWQVEFKQKIVDQGLSETTRDWLVSSTPARIIYFMLTDQVCIWTVVNTACCALVLIGKLLQNVVFGRLRMVEHQQMRDRFWNFVFYKFVFVFGVMNVQYFDEMFMWSIWFALAGFFFLLTTLAQDRFKYVSSSPASTHSSNLRILVFLSVILFCDVGLFGVAATITIKYGLNYGGFLAAECIMLLLRVGHGLLRYGTHFYESNRRVRNWEERNAWVYYVDLMFELSILVTDFVHHLHMLIWSNIFLSMASLVICMQLKHLYQEVDRRLRRHRNHQRIAKYIDSKYPMASLNDLHVNDDKCAICWDRMETARKLTCGHLFHNWCLHGWLEQDTSCPTCRTALSISPPLAADGGPAAGQDGGQLLPGTADLDDLDGGGGGGGQHRRHRTNHFFHFDGRRYARWLPSFSVEVSHNLSGPSILRRNLAPVTNSQMTRMVEQVREMFPHLSAEVIEEDLRETNSVEVTVDNVLNNRVNIAEDGSNAGGDPHLISDVETESEYESDGVSGESSGPEGGANGASSRVGDSSNGGTAAADQTDLLDTDDWLTDHHVTTTTITTLTTPSSSPPLRTAAVSDVAQSAPVPSTSAGRFSKCTEEREVILSVRKRQLIQEHRRRYLNSPRATDLRELLNILRQQREKVDDTQTPQTCDDSQVPSTSSLNSAEPMYNNKSDGSIFTPASSPPPSSVQTAPVAPSQTARFSQGRPTPLPSGGGGSTAAASLMNDERARRRMLYNAALRHLPQQQNDET